MKKMKVIVEAGKAVDGTFVIKQFTGGDYIWTAEPNEHGDLVVYRNHINMLSPQPIASFAAGEWSFHETVWED